MNFITLNKKNIVDEHICCAFSDKKCKQGYEAKKNWLVSQFDFAFEFRKIDERAKVFMELVPSEYAWVPIESSNYLFMGCFWVSGKYKNKGLGKKLLNDAIQKCKDEKKDGIVTIVGKKKYHFMSDTKWLLNQGFEIIEETKDGFLLIVYKIKKSAENPKFKQTVYSQNFKDKDKCVVFYSNRCPYSQYHVTESLKQTCKKRGIKLVVHELDTLQKAQNSPSPATIFSLYLNGKFITTDVSVCMDSRFDKITKV